MQTQIELRRQTAPITAGQVDVAGKVADRALGTVRFGRAVGYPQMSDFTGAKTEDANPTRLLRCVAVGFCQRMSADQPCIDAD